MSSTTLDPPRGAPSTVGLWIGVARPHILAIVFASTLTYGWIFTERHDLLIPLIAVWDWFIVNFTNKATDLEEDLANGIAGAEQIARHKRAVELINWGMIVLGLLAGLLIVPELLPYRALFTLIGLVYNYKWIPVRIGGHFASGARSERNASGDGWGRLCRTGTRELASEARSEPPASGDGSGRFCRTGTRKFGFTRLKETYFFKNFGSSMLFTLSVFIYPLVGLGADYPLDKLLLAIAFFIPLELTYEIIYDLRDVDGDKKEGVPTYPAVHGPRVAKAIIYGLLAFSAIWPIAGAISFELRLREWVVVGGVIQQLVLMRLYCGGERMPSSADAIRITWIGAAQLASYNVWILVGLPLGV